MSLSKRDRTANVEYALKLFLRDVDDNWIAHVHIEPGGDSEYDAIKDTTWKELVLHNHLEELQISGIFRLTGYGWLAGLELLGKRTDKSFLRRLGRMSKVFKDEVKGRKEDRFMYLEQAASRSGLPAGFIANVIDGNLFERWFGRYGAEWESYEGRGQMIKIPSTFGLELL